MQEYDVTKKWVIITEISKEVENKTITRGHVYVKEYMSRRNGDWKIIWRRRWFWTFLSLKLYIHSFCVEIKANTETVTSRMFQKVQTTLVRETHFFSFLSWRRSD